MNTHAGVPFAVFTDDGPECAYLFPLSDTRRTTALAVGDFDDVYLKSWVIFQPVRGRSPCRKVHGKTEL